MPTALHLHIGHGKTGSSYLQSALALSLPALEAAGICYPIAADTAQSAGAGKISGGNIRGVPGALAEMAASGLVDPDRTCLISGESLFHYILKHPAAFAEDVAALRGSDAVPLHVLLYLRDPVDHAVSVYQQQVKRGNFTGTLARSLATYTIPAATLRVLQTLRESGARVSIRNYSRHRDGLIGTLEDWLGLPAQTLSTPPVAQVNRSLTRTELELQRLVNATGAPQSSRVISDPLCNELPDIRSQQPALDPAALAGFLDRIAQEIGSDAYTAAVPEDERPRVGTVSDYAGRFPDPDAEQALSLSPDQLRVLATAIGAEIKRNAELRTQLTEVRRKGAAQRQAKRQARQQAQEPGTPD